MAILHSPLPRRAALRRLGAGVATLAARVRFGAPRLTSATQATTPGGTALPPGRRIALVIGNGAYKSAPLKNPVSDAEAVASSLKALDYDVVLRKNTSLVDLIE